MRSHEALHSWSSTPPRTPGQYWYRGDEGMDLYEVERLDEQLCARSKLHRDWQAISRMRGSWLGPVRLESPDRARHP